jgi:NHLM bacteriocin system ABC transporter peptidase/ATP-binding protein
MGTMSRGLVEFFRTLMRRGRGRSHPHFARTPGLIQIEASECGATALGIVLAYYGRWVSIEELRATCGVSRNGSKASHMVRAAQGYGMETYGVKLEPERLSELKPPVILHWNFSHFVVFEGFERNGRIRINDPAGGRRRVTLNELDQAMTGVVLIFRPGPLFQRGGEPARLWHSLRPRLQGKSLGLTFIFLASLLLLVPGLLMPAFSRLFIDHVLVGHDGSWVPPLLSGMLMTLFVTTVLGCLQRSFLLRFQTQMAVEASGKFFWHLLRLPIEFFDQRFTGDISSRVALNDRLADLLSGDFAVNALSCLVLVFFATFMWQYDWRLTITSVLFAALNLLVLRWVSRERAEGNRRLLREEGKLNSIALWGLQEIESLKATSSERDLFSRWAGQQARVNNIRQNLEIANQPVELLPTLLTAINAALILGIGGLRVLSGNLTLGSLVAFQIMTIAFTTPVNRLVSLGQRLQLAEGEVGLLDDVLRARPELPEIIVSEPQEGTPKPKLRGHLELQKVTFGYSPMAPAIVTDISFILEPGKCVAIVGKTGSGKSTLTKLISGLYRPWEGRLLFDGRDRSELPRSLWIDSVGVVDQEIFVFEGTVRENLSLWNKDVAEEQMLAAARDAGILDEIMDRPGGLDTLVAETGTNWSAGQLQRLEIARALCGEPALLVLDEATSALDSEMEGRIIRNLRDRGCSCLIISHRLSAIRDADTIIVLEQGSIVQMGNHQQLMEIQGPYSRLVIHE